MKPNEKEIRDQIALGAPFTLATSFGERVRVIGHDWVSLPPMEDEDGRPFDDSERSDFFQVWGNGRNYRWVAFASINLIEANAPAA